jgi:SAM-dependent methyltransferase
VDEHERPRLYGDLAGWWPLLSPPEEYEEEAAVYADLLREAAARPVRSVLELGSGGGSNASHMKAHFELTLTDVSPEMLAVSRALNPGCEHIEGDMRTLRLGRRFDAVFVHDAIDYMTTEEDLAAVMRTIVSHCEPGGGIVIASDHVVETFGGSTSHGGHDGEGRALRYLEWTYDPDPSDTTCTTEYVYVLREGSGKLVEHERHVTGLFPRATWLSCLSGAGISALCFTHTFSEGDSAEIFVATFQP